VPVAEPGHEPVSEHELDSLFSELARYRRVILAVSGGPDSTAMLVLARLWRGQRRTGPRLVVATVDHRLRPESKAEAAEVARLAARLGMPHEILTWSGEKPATGLQEAARDARYRLLGRLANKIGADAIATAHTLDDQAETMLMRLARGSGLAGLAGIKQKTARDGVALLRPLLGVPKARLVATLRTADIAYAEDPSNEDGAFTRVRLRRLAPALAAEGITAARLASVARRLARADRALEAVVDELFAEKGGNSKRRGGPVGFDAGVLFKLPDEVAIRALGRAIDRAGDEGPVELGKLEDLYFALVEAYRGKQGLKRTLAGAAASLARGRLTVVRAPARRSRLGRS
jgi:tRNA(Ile)-lysidine synthase